MRTTNGESVCLIISGLYISDVHVTDTCVNVKKESGRMCPREVNERAKERAKEGMRGSGHQAEEEEVGRGCVAPVSGEVVCLLCRTRCVCACAA